MLETKRKGTVVLFVFLAVALAAGCARRGTRPGDGPASEKPPGQVIPESGSVPRAEEVLPQYVTGKNWDYASMPSPEPSAKPATKVNDVSFDQGSATLTRQGIAVCREVVSWMAQNAERSILIVGHANRFEATGDEAVALARRRAEAARDFMVKQLGVAPDRVEVASFGSQHSAADRSEPVRQSIERRVEFWSMK